MLNKTNKACMHEVIPGTVYIAQNMGLSLDKTYAFLSTSGILEYHPVCNDFGPMGMSSVIRFIELLDNKIASHPNQKIVYLVEPGKRHLANSVFLLGAYMILKNGHAAHVLNKRFAWLEEHQVEPFRDAGFDHCDFGLTLSDCWEGLQRGKSLGWLGLPSAADAPWGRIDPAEYDYYSSSINADLTEIVPGKLVALRGPRDLGDGQYLDEAGVRYFSPSYLADILSELGVVSVVQLGGAAYDPAAFEQRGIRHYDLSAGFDARGVPSAAAAAQFLAAADAAGAGAVAVHCASGLGRSGTLAALYLMARRGFGSREAIAWVRIMRPASVVGPQQRFLARIDAPAPTPAAAATAALAPLSAHTPAPAAMAAVAGSAARSAHPVAVVAAAARSASTPSVFASSHQLAVAASFTSRAASAPDAAHSSPSARAAEGGSPPRPPCGPAGPTARIAVRVTTSGPGSPRSPGGPGGARPAPPLAVLVGRRLAAAADGSSPASPVPATASPRGPASPLPRSPAAHLQAAAGAWA